VIGDFNPIDDEAHEWVRELRVKMNERVGDFEKCYRGVSVPVRVELRIDQLASGTGMWATGSTSENCQITRCVVATLKELKLRKLVPKSAQVSETLSFDPQASPRLAFGSAARKDDTPALSCIDPDLPKGGSGRLPPDVIQNRVRAAYPELRACYEKGLTRDPMLKGKVTMRFVIQRDGSVTSVELAGNTLPDCEAVACMKNVFGQLHFPQPEGGVITVVYPIAFSPG
jgi:hypothetical protein